MRARSLQEELFKPRSILPGSPDEHTSTKLYAVGWGVYSSRGRRMVSHSGGIVGFSSQIKFFPDQKWGVAILANADWNGGLAIEAIMSRLEDNFFGITPQRDIMPLLDKRFNFLTHAHLDARKRIYPHVPAPPLPMTLPQLSDYAGSYYDDGYGTIELAVVNPRESVPVAEGTTEVLQVDIRRLMDITLDLEDVSGDFFISWIDTETTNLLVKGGLRAEFRLGSNGRVKKLGLVLDLASPPDDDRMMVWFTKLSS